MVRDSRDRWWCYLLQCADGSLYAGITNALERRVARHNAGSASKYTRGRRPVRLVWCEPALDRGAASRREVALKRLSRAAKQALARAASPPRRRGVLAEPRARLRAERDALVGGKTRGIEAVPIVERQQRGQARRVDLG
jgi:putative endonuclease